MILFWRDYHVVTMSDDCRSAWRWEIRRRSAPMGVKLNGDGYLSQRAAEEAGARDIPDRVHFGGTARMTLPSFDARLRLHDAYAGREQNEQAIAGFRCNSLDVSGRRLLTWAV
jgi:hypothetical protein